MTNLTVRLATELANQIASADYDADELRIGVPEAIELLQEARSFCERRGKPVPEVVMSVLSRAATH
jgi:hypothetical protein